ncbi:carboxypeptidase-like regulatory domain-containing protein [Flavobacterium soli]|uniref:carboxypeptidase-like regulatory domain-containing protein n=1 Tax=Flavobacterium soli TaxID=344881 RepID=UPI000421BF00|nr:carboxypeptidase-like regulatory domain-containing protein [Flavobacterium soli]
MKKSYKKFLLFLILLSNITVQSQLIEGTILDSKTKETLPGATVYLDGTTISTITDTNGYFKINTKGNNATLVVSFIGYSTYRLDNPLQYVNKKLKVMLVEESISLDEVVVGKGPFSRKQMMKVFREQFLGESKAGRSCKILNEDDIVLYYDVSTNTLNASARNPLKIINKHLDYEVNFDLEELIVQYNYKSLDKFNQSRSYFSGTTFYKDMSKNNRADKKRRETFYGSATHFALTVANEAWEKEDIRLFVEGWPVNPKDYFKVKDTLGVKQVTLIKEPQKEVKDFTLDKSPSNNVTFTDKGKTKLVKVNFNILYKKEHQSIVEFVDKVIYVDENGNYSPIYGILYGGYIGTLKAGNMLPIDYYQVIKEMQKG